MLYIFDNIYKEKTDTSAYARERAENECEPVYTERYSRNKGNKVNCKERTYAGQ